MNYNLTEREMEHLDKIMDRVKGFMDGGQFQAGQRMRLEISLAVCHLNGCPLDLEAMTTGLDADLVHDVFGIDRHISRDDGQLQHFFMPRFARANDES